MTGENQTQVPGRSEHLSQRLSRRPVGHGGRIKDSTIRRLNDETDRLSTEMLGEKPPQGPLFPEDSE